MLLGELLVAEKLISQTQLNQALKSRHLYPTHSIGQVISTLFNIPMESIETIMISRYVVPTIEAWFKKNIDKRSKTDDIPLSSSLFAIDITISSFVRYEGEAVTFIRNEMGYYYEESRDAGLEKLALTVDTMKLTTIRKQDIMIHDIQLEFTLGTNAIRAENPGFISEARLKLLHALKQTG